MLFDRNDKMSMTVTMISLVNKRNENMNIIEY